METKKFIHSVPSVPFLETVSTEIAALSLDLKKPRYRKTAAYGHFGRELEEFTWEKTDMIDKLISKL